MSQPQPHVGISAHSPDIMIAEPNQTLVVQEQAPRQETELHTTDQQFPKQLISQAEMMAIIQQAQAGQGQTLQIEAIQAAMAGAKEQQSPGVKITSAVCQLLCGLVFGILFLVYSCTSDLHGSACGDLRDYCYEYGITIVIGTSLTFLLQLDLSNSEITVALKALIGIAFGITSLVFWILLWVALAQDESCGELRTLALVYNWMVVGAIGLGCCCSIVMLVFGAATL